MISHIPFLSSFISGVILDKSQGSKHVIASAFVTTLLIVFGAVLPAVSPAQSL